MNIVFFIHSLIGGGAERVAVNLSNCFVSRGHQVTIVLNKNIVEYELDSKINLYYMPSTERTHFFLLRPFVYIKNKISEYRGVKDVIKQKEPDVIIASWGSKIEAILIAHESIPVISSEHNTFDRKHSTKEKFHRFILNKFMDRVVVLTQYDKDYVRKHLHNAVVIPNPLTFPPMPKDAFVKTFQERRNILACGRVKAYKVKGLDSIIIAFSKIAQKYKDWDLDIAGSGPEECFSKLKEIARTHGVEDRVHFLGFCSNIQELMKSHGIFALTSRSEGFGMVLTEAMAMGCPCVSYALTGPSEIITNDVDGILVENQNIDGMSASLSRLIVDESLRRRLSEKALDNVLRFSVDNIANKWEMLFNEVLIHESHE